MQASEFRYVAASHEAGHCVAYHALGLTVAHATIMRGDTSDGHSGGETSARLKDGDCRPLGERLMAFAAGTMAGLVFEPLSRRESDSDIWSAYLLAEGAGADDPWEWVVAADRIAKMVFAELGPREAAGRVGGELLDRGTLTEADLEPLLRW